ncbi:hypothetical protein M433DRAFT_274174 [Acidomyces richmondensis BFW]|nr:MAG: hypothetical protein FE78DRAFT_426324 [Acidomyces sp. 'richmondensis']KYG45036.1 hypothetical protein M433DRAFT_274174 [Acidomyces richmondensis BFW]
MMPKPRNKNPIAHHLQFATSATLSGQHKNPPLTRQPRRGRKTGITHLAPSQSTLTQLDFVCGTPVTPSIPNSSSDGEVEGREFLQRKRSRRRSRKKNGRSPDQPTYTQVMRALQGEGGNVGKGIDGIREKIRERAGVEVTDWRSPYHQATVPYSPSMIISVRTPTKKRTRWGSMEEVPSSQSPQASELCISSSKKTVLRERSVNLPVMRSGGRNGVEMGWLKRGDVVKRRKLDLGRGVDRWRGESTVLDSEEEEDVEEESYEWHNHSPAPVEGEDDEGDAAEEAVNAVKEDCRPRSPIKALDPNDSGVARRVVEEWRKKQGDLEDSPCRRKRVKQIQVEELADAYLVEEDVDPEEVKPKAMTKPAEEVKPEEESDLREVIDPEEYEDDGNEDDDFPATFNPVYSALDRDAARFLYGDDNEPTQLALEPERSPNEFAIDVTSEAKTHTPHIPSTPIPLRPSQVSTISDPTPPTDISVENSSSPFPLPPWSPAGTCLATSTKFDNDGIGSSDTWTDFSLPPPPPMSGFSG